MYSIFNVIKVRVSASLTVNRTYSTAVCEGEVR